MNKRVLNWLVLALVSTVLVACQLGSRKGSSADAYATITLQFET